MNNLNMSYNYRLDDFLEIYKHGQRVFLYTLILLQKLNLTDEVVSKISTAAQEHDAGKLLCPPEIINKKGLLTPSEYEIIKRHSYLSAKIYADNCVGPVDMVIWNSIMHHHENYDGSGYPSGLKGEHIPLGSRVIRISDTFDALTQERCYKEALSPLEALAIMKKSHSCYDKNLFNIFENNFEDFMSRHNDINVEISKIMNYN